MTKYDSTGVFSEDDFDYGDEVTNMPYESPVNLAGLFDAIPDTGSFLLPLCTTKERLETMLGILRRGAISLEYGAVGDYNIDLLKAMEHIDEPGQNDCLQFNLDETCVTYPPYSSLVTYAPQNPFTQPDYVPDGYLFPPLQRWQDILPNWVPGFLADLLLDGLEEMLGYQDGDVLALIGSMPLFANWQELLTNGLPRFEINVNGAGTVEIHMLAVPFGGRALVTVDHVFGEVDTNPTGDEYWTYLDLDRDFASVPPELDVDVIEEIVLEADTFHTIYVTFFPVVNDQTIPIGFGGGLRKVVVCGEDITPAVTNTLYRQNPLDSCELEESVDGGDNWTVIFDASCVTGDADYIGLAQAQFQTQIEVTQEHLTELETQYDGTPTSINPNIPSSNPPDATEQEALCYSLEQFVQLFAVVKLNLLQRKNGLQLFWDRLQSEIFEFYNEFTSRIGFDLLPDLFGCFVDDATAISALQDDAAMLEVACCLKYELDGVTISQASFGTAISNCLASLSGVAHDILCLIDNENDIQMYVSFLEAYGVALERQIAGDTLECNCSDTWVHTFDFSVDAQGWISGVNDVSVNLANYVNPTWEYQLAAGDYSNSFGFSVPTPVGTIITRVRIECETVGTHPTPFEFGICYDTTRTSSGNVSIFSNPAIGELHARQWYDSGDMNYTMVNAYLGFRIGGAADPPSQKTFKVYTVEISGIGDNPYD